MPATTLTKRGVNLDRMVDRKRKFVSEYVIDLNGTQAAIRAGYSKNGAQVTASRLLNKDLNPDVHKAVGAALYRLSLVAEMSAVELRQHIDKAIRLNPFRFFEPGDNGGWLIDEKKLDEIPDEIGQMVKECEKRTIELPDGTTVSKFWVKLVDKDKMIELSAKYKFSEHHTINVAPAPDWNQLTEAHQDVIETQIIEVSNGHQSDAAPTEGTGS